MPRVAPESPVGAGPLTGDGGERGIGEPALPRSALWAVLGAAMAASVALALWVGRETTLSVDELSVFLTSPRLDLGLLFEPHNGHLVAGSRLIYKVGFEIFGTDYAGLRAFTVACVLILALVTFAYVKRRVGATVALAPALILLFFGTDYPHVLQGNGFGITIALSAGVGALLALERRDTTGDVLACALLCLGLAFYTI